MSSKAAHKHKRNPLSKNKEWDTDCGRETVRQGKPKKCEHEKTAQMCEENQRSAALWHSSLKAEKKRPLYCQDEDDETPVLPTVAVIKQIRLKDQRTLLSIPGNQPPGKQNKTRGSLLERHLQNVTAFLKRRIFCLNCSFSLHYANYQHCLYVPEWNSKGTFLTMSHCTGSKLKTFGCLQFMSPVYIC